METAEDRKVFIAKLAQIQMEAIADGVLIGLVTGIALGFTLGFLVGKRA